MTEPTALADSKTLASQNKLYKSFIGGYYSCHAGRDPAQTFGKPAWYAAHALPGRISQGRMALVPETMVCDLTAMPIT